MGEAGRRLLALFWGLCSLKEQHAGAAQRVNRHRNDAGQSCPDYTTVRPVDITPTQMEHFPHTEEGIPWVREMAQLGKALVTKPDNLNLIPRSHMVEGENPLQKVVLCPWAQAHSPPPRHEGLCGCHTSSGPLII